jgi:hypothetical protein
MWEWAPRPEPFQPRVRARPHIDSTGTSLNHSQLIGREAEVLLAVARGRTNLEIGGGLFMRTVPGTRVRDGQDLGLSDGEAGMKFTVALLAAGLVGAAALPPSATAQSRAVLIRAGEIHTVTNGVIGDGTILVRDGIIEQVGTSVDAPADALEYRAEVVIPGMIDAHAHLALDRSNRSRIPGPFTPEWRAVDHLDLDDPMISRAASRWP